MATTTATGGIATVDSDRPPPLPLDSIPIIDLSLLSQSELFSLSMCSNSSFDLNRCDDVVIPKIDRSVFNESAGSRKQTYSRLRLAPAQSPTSTKTTIHRRTPRLRSSNTPVPNNITGAEQAENSQIIRTLKELFKSDHNFEDLVPIEVEINTNVVVPELSSPDTNRKRERPLKHENEVFIQTPPAKRMCNNTAKKVVAYDAHKDIEIVNSRGVEVNLENLGRLEDPYGVEIRRRTEGMSSKDELLGFLGGLHGEWGTASKRIVDASVFGDALPKGWKLNLSIKKKSDRVWLFCRRYISPSGRQFDSCKEVSMYLISLVEENMNKPTHIQIKNSDDFAPKGASVIVNTNVSVKESITIKRPVVLALFSSKIREFKKQVKSNILDPIDVQVKEAFKCLKCFMIFEGKVDLLDHQVLAHKIETSTEISDWMVVKGGIFECQFCNKTFDDRNQYNEHIGTHETIDKKMSEVSEAEKTVEMESDDATFGDKPVSSSQSDDKISPGTESEMNEHVHDLNIVAHDNKEEPVNMNEDVIVEETGCEIENKCKVEDIDNQCEPVKMNEDVLVEESEKKCDVDENDNQSEGVKMNEDVLVEEFGGEIEKKCNVDDMEIDRDPNVSVSKSDVCLGHEASMSVNENNVNLESYVVTVNCVDDSAIVEKDIAGMSNSEDEVSETVTHVDDKVECILEEGKRCENKIESTNEVLGSVEENVVGESVTVTDEVVNVADSETRVQSPKMCEKKGFWENMNDSSFDDLASEKERVMNENSVGEMMQKLPDSETETESLSLVSPFSKKQESPEKLGFTDSSTRIPSVDHHHVTHDIDYGINSRVDEQDEIRNSVIGSYNMSSIDVVEKEDNYRIPSSVSPWQKKEYVNDDVDIGSKSKETQMNMEDLNKSIDVNLDDFQIFTNNGSVNNENTGVMGLEFSSLVPPVNNQEFSFQDDGDVSGLYESSQRGFLDHFSIPESYDDMFDDNRSIGIHDLSLAFGEQKKDESKIEDSFDVQTDLSMVNNRQSVGGSFCNNETTRDFSNIVFPGSTTTWEDEYRTSGSNQQHETGNGVFRVDQQQRYNGNDGFGLNGSRSEAVEFRFLSGRSEGGPSVGFPQYNNSNSITGMEQGFGTGFWNGKNGRNVITSVCGLCRNQFHVLPETQQGGGVASLCPACTAGMFGPINML